MLECLILILLKDLLWILVKVEAVVFDKFFWWLRSTKPYSFTTSALRAILRWYHKVWKTGKVVLWLLFCSLALPKLLFVLLYITVYLIVCWEGFSIIFLVLSFIAFVASLRHLTTFLKKIIKKGELCFAEDYGEMVTTDVSTFLELRKMLISRVFTLTKKLKLSNGLSFLLYAYTQ